MRKVAYLSLLFFTLTASIASSCEEKKAAPKVISSLFGKWELSYSIKGGYGYQYDPYIHYKLSNGCIFQFNKDSTYKHYENWTLVSKGDFHTRHIKKTGLDEISLGNNSMSYFFQLKNEGLYLSVPTPDAGGDVYERISN